MSVIFKQGNVVIEKNLAKFGSTSYPIANIGSVSLVKIGTGLWKPSGVVLALMGAYLAVTSNREVGALLFLVGAAMFFLTKAKSALVLKTSSGDAQAISSSDHDLVMKIKSAIEQAISMDA